MIHSSAYVRPHVFHRSVRWCRPSSHPTSVIGTYPSSMSRWKKRSSSSNEGSSTLTNCRDFLFVNPARFYGSCNPDFFAGTAIERLAGDVLARIARGKSDRSIERQGGGRHRGRIKRGRGGPRHRAGDRDLSCSAKVRRSRWSTSLPSAPRQQCATSRRRVGAARVVAEMSRTKPTVRRWCGPPASHSAGSTSL